MKLFVVLLLVAVVVCVDASHKTHKINMKSQDIDEGEDSWPSPAIINNFDVPEDFHHHDGDDQGHNENDSGHRHHSRRS